MVLTKAYRESLPKHKSCGEQYRHFGEDKYRFMDKDGFKLDVDLYHCNNCDVYSLANRELLTIRDVEEFVKKHEVKREVSTEGNNRNVNIITLRILEDL